MFGVFGSWIPLIAEGDQEGVSPDLGLGAGKGSAPSSVASESIFISTKLSHKPSPCQVAPPDRKTLIGPI